MIDLKKNSGEKSIQAVPRSRGIGSALPAWILILFFLAALPGCQGGSEEAEEIRLGLIAPLSKGMVQVGTSTLQAAQLKVKAVNRSGGVIIGGKKYVLRIMVEDSRNNPQESVAAAQKLINQKGITALIGPMISGNAIPVARIAERALMPMISPTSTHPETTAGKRYVFRTAVTDSFQGKALSRFALQDLGVVKGAILFDAASACNQTLAKVFRSEFTLLGGEITGFEFYTTGERDFRDQLKRISLTEPGLLFLPNYPHDAVRQMEQARELGLTCPILGSDGWDTMPSEGFAALNGAYFTTLWAPDPENDRNRVFVHAYEKAYNESPDAVAALTYDSVGLIVEALKNQDQADSRAVRDGLAEIKGYQGLTGSVSFEGTGDPIKSVMIMAVKEGKPKLLKSFDPQ